MIEIGSESVYEIKYNKTAAPPRGCIEGSLRKISCPPPRRVLGLIAIADDVVEGFAASARGCRVMLEGQVGSAFPPVRTALKHGAFDRRLVIPS
jgi:hypothetical protein